ncbi:MAG: hypothetical protein Kow0042_25530 [Calditrichia bacterium]
MFGDLFENVHFAFIFSASAMFIAGLYFAPTIVEKNIRWLLVYPRWVARLMEKYFSTKWGFFPLFLTILILNNISLFTGFVSGYGIVFPLLFAFFTGLNVSVIGYDLMGWQGLWHMLVNPIAWLEFPAAWISFGMGLQLGWDILSRGDYSVAGQTFAILLPIYFKYVFTLLLIAAILEAIGIIIAEKHRDQL